jgi:hypothetical protein
MPTEKLYPQLIPGGIYHVNCNSHFHEPDDWVGVCRVIDVVEADRIFLVERLEGITELSRPREDGTYDIGINSPFHKSMTLIDSSPEDIKIEYSIKDLFDEE